MILGIYLNNTNIGWKVQIMRTEEQLRNISIIKHFSLMPPYIAAYAATDATVVARIFMLFALTLPAL
jgi:hypothetical protein